MASLMFYTLVLLPRMLVLRTRTGLYLVMNLLQNDIPVLQRLDIKILINKLFDERFDSKVFFMFECCFHQWKYFFFCPWRFLVFFDDGFAQYLPVKKLHHVYHTGIKCLRVYNIYYQNNYCCWLVIHLGDIKS